MKLIQLLKEINQNPDNIILPFNIYYIQSNSELRDLGLDEGVVTEPELMFALWSDYQGMRKFNQNLKSGGDKYTNMMQDIGFNMGFDSDEDDMFFNSRMSSIIDYIELYVFKNTKGTKERELIDSHTKFTYGIYWDDEGQGLDFKYSKQEADKYNYMLIDNEEFKQFTETIKNSIL